MTEKVNLKNSFKPDPYYSEEYATFGDRLCAAREKTGTSQSRLASRLGVKTKTIQAWEEDASEPRANKLVMVSALLNVSMVWLMSGLGNGVEPPQEKEKIWDSEEADILMEIQSLRYDSLSLQNKITKLEKVIRKKFLNVLDSD
jgi:transcriptional regulator with XRE-family HTH domain